MADISLKIGDRIKVVSKNIKGKIAYIGNTQFGSGIWYGIVLDSPLGKNDGTVQGIIYFNCQKHHGLFVRKSQLQGLKKSTTNKKQVESKKAVFLSLSLTTFPTQKKCTKSDEILRGKNERVPASPHVFRENTHSEKSCRNKLQRSFSRMKLETELEHRKVASIKKDKEVQNLKEEVESLRKKLQVSEIQRTEYQRIVETQTAAVESAKAQWKELRQFKRYASTLKTQIKFLMSENNLIEKKRNALEVEMASLSETTEYLIIEKEMAEESNELCEDKLNETLEKFDDFRTELAVAKVEMEIQSVEGVPTKYAIKTLQSQNEELIKMLVKWRNHQITEKLEEKRLKSDLESLMSENKKLKDIITSQNRTIEEYIKEIEEVKEELDLAANPEPIIHQITAQNLTLEEELSETLVKLENLEKLHDVNEELEEAMQETEVEYRIKLESSEFQVLETKKELETKCIAIADLERTMEKFRDMTKELKNENEKLRSQLQQELEKVKMAVPLAENLKSSQTPFLQAAKLENLRIEVELADQRFQHWSAFLPESFFSYGAEHEAISLVVLISRLLRKTNLITSQIRKIYPYPENFTKYAVLNESEVEHYCFGNKVQCMIYSLEDLLHQYRNSLNNGSVEHLLKMGTIFMEMEIRARVLDNYIELLCKNNLDVTKLTDLDKVLVYFRSVYNSHLNTERLDYTALVDDCMKIVGLICDSIHIYIKTIQIVVESSDGCLWLEEFSQFVDVVILHTRKIRLTSNTNNTTLYFGDDVVQQLSQIKDTIQNSEAIMQSMTKRVVQHTMANEYNGQRVEDMMFVGVLQQDNGDGGQDILHNLKSSLKYAGQFLAKLSHSLENGEYIVEVNTEMKMQSAIDKRAKETKKEQDTVLIVLRQQLEIANIKVNYLRKALKLRDSDLSLMQARKHKVDKKQKTALKPHSNIKIDVSNGHRIKDSTIDSSIDHHYKGLILTPTYIPLLLAELHDTQLALKHVHNYNVQLQSRIIQNQLLTLPPLNVHKMINHYEKHSVAVVKLTSNTRKLQEEMAYLILPRVVDITRGNSRSSFRKHQVELRFKLRTMQEKVKVLTLDLMKLKAACRGQQIVTEFQTFTQPASFSLCDKKELAARITIPQIDSKLQDPVISMCVSIKDFNRIHSCIFE